MEARQLRADSKRSTRVRKRREEVDCRLERLKREDPGWVDQRLNISSVPPPNPSYAPTRAPPSLVPLTPNLCDNHMEDYLQHVAADVTGTSPPQPSCKTKDKAANCDFAAFFF